MQVNKRSVRVFLKAARWLHVYCSTALFALLVFFSVTGITLNHRWYNSDANHERVITTTISKLHLQEWNLGEAELWHPDVNAIRDYISYQYQLNNPSSIQLDNDFGEVVLEYLLPAGFASVIVSRDEASLVVETEAGSLLGVLNDLHKGRHSGVVWMWLIDISSVLIIFFSLTGMIILFQGKKYRLSGIVSALLGTLTPILIYLIFVPRIGY